MKCLKALFATLFLGAFVLQFPTAGSVQAKEQTLYRYQGDADGAEPYASLIDVHGTLYGTTWAGGGTGCGGEGCGAVFSYKPSLGAETVLYSFCGQTNCADGANPYASLINVNGTLYGTTYEGGRYNQGTIFSLDPGTGTENVVHSFCSQTNCTDGANPRAGLIDVNGTLYGTTYAGGSHNSGTVFSLDPSTRAESVLYSFCARKSCADGRWPYAGLIDLNGTLYGTTYAGGSHDAGTVFSLDPGNGAHTVLHSFCSRKNCADGAFPSGGLIDVNGVLYGTTQAGGTACNGSGCGTVFSIDPSTGAETARYAFAGNSDGVSPEASLIEINGVLYGTTYYGGRNNGIVFSFDPGTGTEKVLYTFCTRNLRCKDGGEPLGSLLQVREWLYGTTRYGGERTRANGDGNGVVFRLTLP